MSWQFNRTEAVFLQIAARLRQDILNGTYLPGEQIPPVRQLAFEASVNPNTVQRALLLLENEGFLHARGTVGRFVTTDASLLDSAKEAARKDTIRSLIREVHALGITKEELLLYFEEEVNRHE